MFQSPLLLCLHTSLVILVLNPPISVCLTGGDKLSHRSHRVLLSLSHIRVFFLPASLSMTVIFFSLSDTHTHMHTFVSPVGPVRNVTFFPSEAPLWSRQAWGERGQFNPPSIFPSSSLPASLSPSLVPADLFVPLVFTSSSPSVWLSVHPDSVRPLFFLSHLYPLFSPCPSLILSHCRTHLLFSLGTLIGKAHFPPVISSVALKAAVSPAGDGRMCKPPCTDKVQNTVLVSSLF